MGRQKEAALSEREREKAEIIVISSVEDDSKSQLHLIYLTLGVSCHNYASWVFNSFLTLEVEMIRCILVVIKALLKENNPSYL